MAIVAPVLLVPGRHKQPDCNILVNNNVDYSFYFTVFLYMLKTMNLKKRLLGFLFEEIMGLLTQIKTNQEVQIQMAKTLAQEIADLKQAQTDMATRLQAFIDSHPVGEVVTQDELDGIQAVTDALNGELPASAT